MKENRKLYFPQNIILLIIKIFFQNFLDTVLLHLDYHRMKNLQLSVMSFSYSTFLLLILTLLLLFLRCFFTKKT